MSQRQEPTIGSIDVPTDTERRPAQPPDREVRPRKLWLTLLWSLACTPIAFAYVGRFSWAVLLYAFITLVLATLGLSGFVQSVAGIYVLLGCAIVFLMASIIVPWLLARGTARNYRLKWYNRWYLYPILAAVLNGPFAYLAFNKQQFFGFGIYRVPSGSMSLTIMPGDLIVVDTRTAIIAALKPTDVVTMFSTKRPDQMVVKRIVAGPGQHVQIDEAGLRVDGQVQSHAHTQGGDLMETRWMLYPNVQLGRDEFYVMGDNRGNSLDSRTEGPVPRANLAGKVTAIYYSDDFARIGKVE